MDMELFQDAKWITCPMRKPADKDGGHIGLQTAYFRLCFDAPGNANLTLSLSAHSRYRLLVNGNAITYGPCKGDRWRQFYETVDVGKHLVHGRNVIAVKVISHPPYEAQKGNQRAPYWTMAKALGPSLVVSGFCLDENDNVCCDIGTGKAGWTVCADTAVAWRHFTLTHWMGAMESVEGARLPQGWETAEDKSREWVTAEVLWPADDINLSTFGIIPVFPLTPRPIPLMFEREGAFQREMPLKESDLKAFSFMQPNQTAIIPPNSAMAVELDAGTHRTAFLLLRMAGGSGSEVTIRYAESYMDKETRHKGGRDDWENHEIVGHEDTYFPGGGKESYSPFWFRTFRFVRIEVVTAGEALTLETPVLRDTGYPLEIRSRIEADQPWVKQLWDISVRTLEHCMHETYEDCPYYEQLQYIQDTRLEILFTYMTSGDLRMPLRAIEDFHSSLLPEGMLQARFPTQEPLVIPPFSLHWIFMVLEVYQQTGDASIARRYRTTVDAILEWYHRKIGKLGLVDNLGYWDQIDWVDQWDKIAGRTPASAVGPSTTHNLMYACALQAGARICAVTNRPGVAEEYEQRAESILKAVASHCWNEEDGLYMEGPGFPEYSQHAQVYAVLTGLAAGEAGRNILAKALDREGIALCSFTWQYFLFRALDLCGAYERTEKLWELWKSLLPNGLTTIPEVPDGVDSPRSDCHAWGALPLYEFTRYFLGASPTTPGWNGITIAPRTLSLTSCNGVVTTPKGPVHVSWEKEDTCFRIRVESPEGIPLTLVLPDGQRKVFPDGGIVTEEADCQ